MLKDTCCVFNENLQKINVNIQSGKMEEVTEKLERSLSIDTEMEKYDRYRQDAKAAALRGELHHALELFQLAYKLHPSDKLKKRILAIQELIQREEEEEDEEEEEEFVDVNDCGLKLYKGLYDKLYEHQKQGVAFLYSLYRDGRKGGILADDMGLGKTIQVISFLSGMYDAELANHTLLVMPTSLIKNWVREFAKWTPGMRVKEFHGASKVERNRNLERIQRKGGVIITTYQMLINNFEQLATIDQREFHWDYVILDEAHKIKTSSTKTAKSAHAIPARNRVLLTGTPVQNNLREMWALFDFACQGSLLGTSKTFKTEYENPITRAREKDATPGEKALGLRISQNLMDIIKPYFLRRTKADVQHQKQKASEKANQNNEDQENKCPNAGNGAEMPSLTRKNDLIVWSYLSSVQEDIYNQFISLDQIKELLLTTRSPLAELTVLKKLCDHPRLLSARAVTQLGLEQGSAADTTTLEDESVSAASQIDHISDETLIAESGKLQFVVSLMECLREEGHRTLIFSQSRKMLDIMERVLRNRGFRLLRLDGTVTQLAEREKRITLFQTDRRYTIFLLTTQVGGVGITLTAANRVVIFDPSWNPATDAQAVDRAYRIGQTENVIIYRLITCGTVEEKIYRRQVFKDSLIRQTTGDKKNPFRYFSKQELRELFKLEDTRSSSTQQQLQAMHAQNRRSDTSLDQHIARLHSMEMFGISDHDLMFSKEAAADEDAPENAESHQYIQTRVQKAQELMQAESELHGQLMDSIAQNTEPAWLRQSGQHGMQTSGGRDRPAPPRNKYPPITVDLTHCSSDEPELEEEEKNSLSSVEDVQVLSENGGVHVKDESPQLDGARNSPVLKTEVSPAADRLGDSHQVIVLDDSLNVEDESNSNTTSKQQSSEHSSSQLSHQFPKLGDLSAADALENGKPQTDKPLLIPLSSPVTTTVESPKTEVELLQGNFNLQLEDSADMFSVDEEENNEENESVDEESPEFQLQMDFSGEKLEEASIHDSRENSNYNNDGISNYDKSEVSKHEAFSPALNTTRDDSFVHSVRKKKTQVIKDSEEEEEDEDVDVAEMPCLTSSPLVGGINRLGSSTPKTTQTDNTRLRRSLNTSVASRRSFVMSMIDDDSDEESGEPIATDNEESEEPSAGENKESEGPSAVEDEESEGPSAVEDEESEEPSAVEDEKSEEPSAVEDEESEGPSAVEDEDSEEPSKGENEESEEPSAGDIEDPDEHGAGENETYQTSEFASCESLLEEEEPSGDTLNTEECESNEEDELEEVEESLGSRGEQMEEGCSALEESTADVELNSSEIMDHCAPKTIPPETHVLPVGSIGNAVTKPSENTYESLVLSGKRCLSEGRKQEALDFFLKAIDINTGDAEIQLLIIQLYRQLSQ